VLSFNQEIESQSIYLIQKHQLKTLDSIQLASCLSQKDFVDSFIVSDKRLKQAAENEKLNLIDPTEP
jgi:predicted nucleic acid-binding protein